MKICTYLQGKDNEHQFWTTLALDLTCHYLLIETGNMQLMSGVYITLKGMAKKKGNMNCVYKPF